MNKAINCKKLVAFVLSSHSRSAPYSTKNRAQPYKLRIDLLSNGDTRNQTKTNSCFFQQYNKTPFLSRNPVKGRVLNSISCCRADHSIFVPAKPVSSVIRHSTSSTFERRAVISSSQRST